jgi:hypothetical protein
VSGNLSRSLTRASVALMLAAVPVLVSTPSVQAASVSEHNWTLNYVGTDGMAFGLPVPSTTIRSYLLEWIYRSSSSPTQILMPVAPITFRTQ